MNEWERLIMTSFEGERMGEEGTLFTSNTSIRSMLKTTWRRHGVDVIMCLGKTISFSFHDHVRKKKGKEEEKWWNTQNQDHDCGQQGEERERDWGISFHRCFSEKHVKQKTVNETRSWDFPSKFLTSHSHTTCLSFTWTRGKGSTGGRHFTLSFALLQSLSFSWWKKQWVKKKYMKRCMTKESISILSFDQRMHMHTVWSLFSVREKRREEEDNRMAEQSSWLRRNGCRYLRRSLIEDIQSHPVLSLPEDFQLHLLLLMLVLLDHRVELMLLLVLQDHWLELLLLMLLLLVLRLLDHKLELLLLLLVRLHNWRDCLTILRHVAGMHRCSCRGGFTFLLLHWAAGVIWWNSPPGERSKHQLQKHLTTAYTPTAGPLLDYSSARICDLLSQSETNRSFRRGPYIVSWKETRTRCASDSRCHHPQQQDPLLQQTCEHVSSFRSILPAPCTLFHAAHASKWRERRSGSQNICYSISRWGHAWGGWELALVCCSLHCEDAASDGFNPEERTQARTDDDQGLRDTGNA